VFLYLATLNARHFLQLPLRGIEGIAHRNVRILVMRVIDDDSLPGTRTSRLTWKCRPCW